MHGFFEMINIMAFGYETKLYIHRFSYFTNFNNVELGFTKKKKNVEHGVISHTKNQTKILKSFSKIL